GRLGSGLVGVFERTRQIGLATNPALSQSGELEGRNGDVGVQTPTLDLSPCGGAETSSSQTDGTATAQRNDAHNRALAKGLAAEQQRPVVVLQGAGDKLGLSRGAAVDQCHDRQALGEVAGGGADSLDVRRFAALDGDDVALVDEGVSYGDRGIEGPSWVVP